MLMVQLRKVICADTYVEISKPVFREPCRPDEMVYEGEAHSMPVLYDDRRIDKLASGVNRFGNPAILIKLEY